MAFREVDVVEVREVLRGWLGGGGLRTIAERAGVDRKTVRYAEFGITGVMPTRPLCRPRTVGITTACGDRPDLLFFCLHLFDQWRCGMCKQALRLAGVRSPRRGRKPITWTPVDRDYETLRIDLQTLFTHLGITTTQAQAA